MRENTDNIPIKEGEKRDSNFSLISSLEEISKILRHQWPESREKLYELTNELERFRDKFATKLKNNPEKLFDQLTDFLNYDLLKLIRRKFYNNAPNITVEAYAQSSLTDQYLNNMLNPNTNIEGEYFGGSCFHRAIFLKKLIDSWDIKWLKTQIVKYKEGNHSFVLVSFQEESFKAEIHGKDNKIIEPLGEYYNIQDNIPLVKNAIKVNEVRGIKNEIKIMYVNKDWEEHIVNLDKEGLEFCVGWSFIQYNPHNIRKTNLENLSSKEIFEYIIEHATIRRKDLSEYAEDKIKQICFAMIEKTNPEEIRNIFL